MKMKIGLVNIILLLFFSAVNVFADDGFVNPVYSPDFVQQQQVKLSSVEQLFPRLIYQETFDGTTRPSVSRNKEDHSKNAYLWFQYSNADLVGEANRSAVTIDYPWRIEKYTSVAGERTYTTFYELREFENDYQVHTFDMIRFDGYTSVYIDNHFVTGFEDGLSGRFYMLFGVGLEPGGVYATGQFDNFVIRVM